MISILEKAFSDSMLLIAEKPNMEFKIDTNGLLRTSTKERYDAYAVGIKSGFLSRNDVRRKENMDVIEGLDLYSYSLADVLYDPKSKTYQIFNKGEIASFEKGGGEKSETTN
ncbi:phage portal protein [Lachnospiraceae bacterium NSJ-12]|uniref:Phage portal protein n=2 Tax=Zhenhengia yiwuensis TaxID=2763666 RepID=A0A926EHQ7_9FIRM|nr:phage portal protein [Zhenhengia yiwuensis]